MIYLDTALLDAFDDAALGVLVAHGPAMADQAASSPEVLRWLVDAATDQLRLRRGGRSILPPISIDDDLAAADELFAAQLHFAINSRTFQDGGDGVTAAALRAAAAGLAAIRKLYISAGAAVN